MMASAPCPACQGALRPRLRSWLRRCEGCGLWASDLQADRIERTSEVSEPLRADALEALRRANFEVILDVLERRGPLAGARLLEVGSAHGWFLEAAAARGMAVLGVEPDDAVAAQTRTGLEVRRQYFPAALAPDETFDVIAFNDVFEHLPGPREVLAACGRHLRPGGRLVLNLPDADGALFRTACLLARAGMSGPLERLWQAHFRFPHLWYFDARTLPRLLAGDFALEYSLGLPILKREGLWARVRMDRSAGLGASLVAYAGLWTLAPLLKRAPDILLQVYEPSRRA
jgi:SAM-dependent methyltransferase